MPKLVRITTVPISLRLLITGQMKFMKEHGFDVTMYSAAGEDIDAIITEEGCPHEIVPMTRQITPLKDIMALWILFRKLRLLQPDIVHSHTPKAGLIGMIAAWMARVPIRLHTVAGLPLEATTGVKKKLLIFIEWLTYRLATQVWPNSNSLFNLILSLKLTSSNKLWIIGKGSSNGIDISEFNVNALDDNILNKIKDDIDYNTSYTYLLFVGRIVKDKGIEELVLAFQRLRIVHNKLKLILVGPFEAQLDPLTFDIMQMIENDKNIISTGFSTEVNYFMHLSDLFVFPSHREGFPNVPMQAALMDCPVIASRITGNIDIVDDNENGLLHRKGDVNDLFEKVNYALENLERMKEMNIKLKEKIISFFDRNKVQSLILNAYNEQINSLESSIK